MTNREKYRHNLFCLVIIIFICGLLLPACSQPESETTPDVKPQKPQPVSLSSLLDEMIDRDAVTRFPNPAYKCLQTSSYDRRSISPDLPGWFANSDYSNYYYQELYEGRMEYTLLETAGPGAVVRFWITAGNYNWTIRVYLDRNPKPVIETSIQNLVGGNFLTGSPLSAEKARGRNLYLPIPYSKYCIITVEYGPGSPSPLYYLINYRTYEQGTEVETFSMENLQALKGKIDSVQETLRTSSEEPGNLITAGITVPKNGSYTFDKINSANTALKNIVFKVNPNNDFAQTLRSTVISIKFDDKETVWCPIGDFFGSGVGINPYKSWFQTVKADGTLISLWSMPFKNSAEVSLINYGDQDLEISAYSLTTGPYIWDNYSMYFHADWWQQRNIPTRAWEGVMDWNYTKINGRGVYVGDVLSLMNYSTEWWGEGDEKIYVDGEAFPSHFGTGTEDYYGYAWCSNQFFEAPFHFQPRAEGPGNYGNITNGRVRALDGIPFKNSLRFDMEILHQAQTKVDYAIATFWYGFDGASTVDFQSRSNQILEVKSAVSYKSPYFLNIPGFRIETPPTGGELQNQSMSHYGSGWENNDQLWWSGARPGDKLEIIIGTQTAGRFRLVAKLTKANDYGIIQFRINGDLIGEPQDLYNPSVFPAPPVEIGVVDLAAGDHIVQIEITGKNEAAFAQYMVGIDWLRLEVQ